MVTPTGGQPLQPIQPPMADIESAAMRKIQPVLSGLIQTAHHEDAPAALKQIGIIVEELNELAPSPKVESALTELKAAAERLEKVKVPLKNLGPAAAPMKELTAPLKELTPSQLTENKALVADALVHLQKAEGILA